ncbi:aspartate/glutamate racemase family protein [Sedimentitalea sp.]|uniref:aspartate/glutamate racemase family protein n=1 Tax=Sedimentitalea sp. TaxID=2048915 RepID=UPI003296B31A
MELLIVNSNTTTGITDLLRDEAVSLATPGTRVTAITAPFGAAGIETPEDVEIAAEATRVAVTGASPPDAAIIACFSDPGLFRIREEVSFPVIGIAEAAILRATELGDKFSILTVAPSTVPGIRAIVEAYGKTCQLAGIHALPTGVLQSHRDRDRTAREMSALAELILASDRPDVLVLGGAITAGMSRQLAPTLPVPLLDGLSCAIRRVSGPVSGAPYIQPKL